MKKSRIHLAVARWLQKLIIRMEDKIGGQSSTLTQACQWNHNRKG